MPKHDFIHLRDVRQNNLKGFDLNIPLGKLVVVTGLSGTGKSSLVFDTLHAEGQRRYVETFSPYTRQFLELLARPDVHSIENIRPSIALRQGNTVRTSRSTVGTMTELCDHFKNWFPYVAQLHDPATGTIIEKDNPQSIWRKALKAYKDQRILLTFEIRRAGSIPWKEIFQTLSSKGYTRIVIDGQPTRIDQTHAETLQAETLYVIQDRLHIRANQRSRFLDACKTALEHGHGEMQCLSDTGNVLTSFSEHLRSAQTGEAFAEARPALFSFNSPVGACPRCRGFGRVIEVDYRKVIPDTSLSILEGAIRPFQGDVYSECLRELGMFAEDLNIPLNTPWCELSEKQKNLVIEGDPNYGKSHGEWPNAWYGVRRFFDWMETKTYKMHVRVMLSKYRVYRTCSQCQGTRLKPQALHWKWQKHTLPELYQQPVSELLLHIEKAAKKCLDRGYADPERLALEAIRTRLSFLNEVGLGYLSLDRASRTLSGGEVERVNLTACLGNSLVETLFILDEPSVGLHASDIDRLIGILRKLTEQGNTVVVVEHDEAVMRAADHLIELGPEPGEHGGHIIYSGSLDTLTAQTTTGAYLLGDKTIEPPLKRRVVQKQKTPYLKIRGATKHNIQRLNLDIPLQRLVALSGISGSGKSTLLDNILYQGYLDQRGQSADDPAQLKKWSSDIDFSEVVLVDQSPLGRTPRSNPALYADAWNPIRQLFAALPEAQAAGLSAAHFSFNHRDGRCEHCEGLGFEKVEMQFLSEIYVPCPICEGQRFKPEVLEIQYEGKSVADILAMTLSEARVCFKNHRKIEHALAVLDEVGLGYLRMGQPINTLSGGESQRLKLVRYLTSVKDKPALLLLDEPTTGLHRHDISRLISMLQSLIDKGHSMIVIEHQTDILKCADWLIELGPGAGNKGGKVVFEGTPEAITQGTTPTAPYLKEALWTREDHTLYPNFHDKTIDLAAAEPQTVSKTEATEQAIILNGAREHNLKNISLKIPRNAFTVVTGVSGSGKSTLAFDILFAEGQRRFMDCVSSYARQFVEQMARPDIDRISGIPPTVAIEQRVTHGTRKSTVATITEVAQYLRLLYARVGIQHSPHNDAPLISQSMDSLAATLHKRLSEQPKTQTAYLCAPLVRSRKGHHQPIANWAAEHGYTTLRCDGKLVEVEQFQPLDRYKEHDVEVVVQTFKGTPPPRKELRKLLDKTLKLGKASALLIDTKQHAHWLSTERTDPVTGETFPELDPKNFSWNSPKGWCPTCQGYGYLAEKDSENDGEVDKLYFAENRPCPDCKTTRLNPLSRAVKLHFKKGDTGSLPELLSLPPRALLEAIQSLKLDRRGKLIVQDILPQIEERLAFMDAVGLGYLTLDRPTATLSGGEAQRIRLAAQLGSTLAGVLYILDEPSIGLHARDNARLLDTLKHLRERGNTLVVVEHNAETMRRADSIIDLGPGAGIHGGEIIAQGNLRELLNNKHSLTGRFLKNGIAHPQRGAYRKLPKAWSPRSQEDHWIVLREPSLRNLKGDDLHLPRHRLNVVCGISGAGKSTLIRDLLRPALETAIQQKAKKLTGKSFNKTKLFKDLYGATSLAKVIEVDQSPIGKTPRSTPATYIGALDAIRQFFANIPEARMYGHTASTFSFNTQGGRCETCAGAGRIKVEMNFLPDTYVPCEDCGGSRYGDEVSEIRWNGKNIGEVLDMSFEEATEFFASHANLAPMMQLMCDTGLGYIKLGQSSPTLSGGEAQRLKLVSELVKGLPSLKQRKLGTRAHNLYILEEPTIGLHLSDCEKLIGVLHRLIDDGHTVIVIEHHTDIIREADYVVEIGPEGGDAGGRILYQGDLAGLKKCKASQTSHFL